APATIPRYLLNGLTDEVGQSFVVVGYGASGHGSTGADASGVMQKRAARNRYEAPAEWLDASLPGLVPDPTSPPPPAGAALAYDFDSGMEQNNTLAAWGFESDLGWGDAEGGGAPGDSGSAEFIDGAIAGILSGGLPAAAGADFTDAIDASWGEVTVSTRVSSFREFVLEATDGTALFITAGDFNRDGRVEGGDFLAWQRGESADALSGAELADWLADFNATPAFPTNSATLEPATLASLLLCIGALAMVRLIRVLRSPQSGGGDGVTRRASR
ncbi:MAG: hypothetical protein AAF961_07485, partial [Planctomycetota bacterium]